MIDSFFLALLLGLIGVALWGFAARTRDRADRRKLFYVVVLFCLGLLFMVAAIMLAPFGRFTNG